MIDLEESVSKEFQSSKQLLEELVKTCLDCCDSLIQAKNDIIKLSDEIYE